MSDRVLNRIVRTLIDGHGCHTVILYGSRARGDFTATSDYDIAGVTSRAVKLERIAKKVDGVYWDVWIYPEKDLKKPDRSKLFMRDGRVLIERNSFGTKLLNRLAELNAKGPQELQPWEVQLKRTWSEKTLARSRRKDPEGAFRRLELLVNLLEDYFVLRKKWFRGSKQGLEWLKKNDPSTHKLFSAALRTPHNTKTIKKLLKKVIV